MIYKPSSIEKEIEYSKFLNDWEHSSWFSDLENEYYINVVESAGKSFFNICTKNFFVRLK